MFCQNCGKAVDNDVQFCPNCGVKLMSNAASQQSQYQAPQSQYQQSQYQAPQPQYQQSQYQAPQSQYQQSQYQAPQPQYQQPQYQTPQIQQPELGMGWFKFLIYFSLFAGAVLNALTGISMLTGTIYGSLADEVYDLFEDLQAFDMAIGVAMLAIAAMGIYVRFRLSGYHKNGPAMLNILYVAAAIVQLVYVIGVYAMLPEDGKDALNLSSTFSSIAVSIAMVAVNTKYFKNREHLFVND